MAVTDLMVSPAPQQDVIDLRKYFSVINVHKWRILGLAVLVTLITILAVLNIRSQYSATATLLIESQQAKAISIEEVYGMNSSQQEYYLTQFEILKSRSLAQTVVERMDLAP